MLLDYTLFYLHSMAIKSKSMLPFQEVHIDQGAVYHFGDFLCQP